MPLSTMNNVERIILYRWLGLLFQRECDQVALRWYRSEAGRTFLFFLAERPSFVEGATKIRSFFTSNEPTEDLLLRLAGTFSGLFHGTNPSRSVPPCQSHYVEENGLLYGESTAAMEQFLVRHDLAFDNFSEPADHIAVPLQLMAHFLENDIGQAEFEKLLSDHLGTWVDKFAADCIRLDTSGLYAGAAQILTALLAEERAIAEKTHANS